jgi:hypothetical protein
MSSQPEEQTPPLTGDDRIDAALAALDLTGPVADHHQRLSAVHDVLGQVLNPDQRT